MKGKEPICKVFTESQQTIIVMAKTLNREDILLRLIGQGNLVTALPDIILIASSVACCCVTTTSIQPTRI